MIDCVVVNYHTAALLPGLLDDLLGEPAVAGVVVVDNSGELEPAMFADRQRVLLLRPGSNLGFAAAVNLAVPHLTSEYVLLVNPDIRLFPGCLPALLAAARDSGAVLTGPRFYWDAGKRFRLPPSLGACGWLDFAQEAAARSRLDAEHLSFYWQLRFARFWEQEEPFAEPFLSGACLLVDRPWALGHDGPLLDPRFFLYYEDTDLSSRAAFAGRLQLCVPAAEALHYYDQSPPPGKSKAALMVAAHERFKEKYYPGMEWSFAASGAAWQPVAEDLGELQVPPVLSPAGVGNDRGYFEIGINPVFVPCAQAVLAPGEVPVIPPELWARQAPGIYYGRLRDS
ncbi:MAG: glycosyltransferase family 2 protein, partial [Deltaproteobacteria bacterium]|nr:glycosyltransferase family 2 protein [Deltaproteobacteria bacterium]